MNKLFEFVKKEEKQGIDKQLKKID